MPNFRLLQKIGQGSYSQVYKAIDQTTQRQVAIKIIQFKDAPKSYIESRELKMISQCRHPNIAPLLQCIVTQSSLYLVFEYYKMNLSQFYRNHQKVHQRKLSERQVKHIMIQICSALKYLHAKGIMHRDIKPENIMIDPVTQQVKLIDFGFAKQIDRKQNTGYIVTRWYRPLEVVLGLKYDQKVDVFAVGAIYLELIHGEQLFKSKSNQDQLDILLDICGYPSENTPEYKALTRLNIQNRPKSPYLSSLLQKVSDQTRQVLTKVLSNSQSIRPSIGSLLQHLTESSTHILPLRSRQIDSIRGIKRSYSTAQGLTLVSLAYSSKEKIVQKSPQLPFHCWPQLSQKQEREHGSSRVTKRMYQIGE